MIPSRSVGADDDVGFANTPGSGAVRFRVEESDGATANLTFDRSLPEDVAFDKLKGVSEDLISGLFRRSCTFTKCVELSL